MTPYFPYGSLISHGPVIHSFKYRQGACVTDVNWFVWNEWTYWYVISWPVTIKPHTTMIYQGQVEFFITRMYINQIIMTLMTRVALPFWFHCFFYFYLPDDNIHAGLSEEIGTLSVISSDFWSSFAASEAVNGLQTWACEMITKSKDATKESWRWHYGRRSCCSAVRLLHKNCSLVPKWGSHKSTCRTATAQQRSSARLLPRCPPPFHSSHLRNLETRTLEKRRSGCPWWFITPSECC